jgi:hypothetical protein
MNAPVGADLLVESVVHLYRDMLRWIACYTAAVLSSHPLTLLQRIRSVSAIALNDCSERGSRQSSSNRGSPNDSRSCQVVEGARKTPRHSTEHETRRSVQTSLAGTLLGTVWGIVSNGRLIEQSPEGRENAEKEKWNDHT